MERFESRLVWVAMALSLAVPGRGAAAELAAIADERPAAYRLWSDPVVEVGVGYRGGLVQQILACADDASTYYTNAACVGGDVPVRHTVAASQPGGVAADLAVYPARTVGVDVSLAVDLPHPSVYDGDSMGVGGEFASGPVWTLLAGPVFRLHNPVVARGPTVAMHVTPGLFVRHGRLRPIAGSAVTSQPPVLDSGTWGWTLPGIGADLELDVEMTRSATFHLGVHGGVSFPAASPRLIEVRPAEDAFARSFEPLQLGGGCVGGAVGFAFVPPGGQIAVEPTLQARWSQTTLAIADEPTTRDGDADGFELRTYSTQQVTLTILGQLTFRITIAPQR